MTPDPYRCCECCELLTEEEFVCYDEADLDKMCYNCCWVMYPDG